MKRNKYSNNRKIIIDGIKFHSKLEAKRYQELKLLEKAGKIVDLELQPKFELQEKFKYNGKSYRSIVYIADFRYIDVDLGQSIIEDVKGFETKDYKIKKKLFLKKFNDIIFIEVRK